MTPHEVIHTVELAVLSAMQYLCIDERWRVASWRFELGAGSGRATEIGAWLELYTSIPVLEVGVKFTGSLTKHSKSRWNETVG